MAQSTPTSTTNSIEIFVRIYWNGSSYVNEAQNLSSITGNFSLNAPNENLLTGRQVISTATITLYNDNFRYSPWYTSGPLYTLIGNGIYHVPVEILVDFNGSSYSLFVGYVKSFAESIKNGTVTLTCHDSAELAKQNVSSTIYQNKMEHEYIVTLLTMAGFEDGNDFISPTMATSLGTTPTIDFSNIPIRYAWLDDETIWDEIIDVARAHGSRAYWGANGKFYYQKGWHWVSGTAVVSDINVDKWSDIVPSYTDKDDYDKIVVEYGPRYIGQYQQLWEATRIEYMYPGESKTIIAKFATPVITFNTPELVSCAEVTNNTIISINTTQGYCLNDQCDLTVTTSAQQCTLVFTNNSSEMALINRFQIWGVPLLGEPTDQVEVRINPSGDRTLTVPQSPYLQHQFQASQTADFLAWWNTRRKTTWRIPSLPGNPAVVVGNRYRLVIPDIRNSILGLCTKLGWQLSIDKNGAPTYSQDITLMEDVFQEELGSNSLFVVGTDTWGASGKVYWF